MRCSERNHHARVAIAVRRSRHIVNRQEALAFVKRHGIILESARGPVPSLTAAIVGSAIRGSWWGHPKSKEIFRVINAICDSPDVLVCKLVGDRITYVHRRLWPALVKLAPRFRKGQLAKVWNEHTATGAHRARRKPFPTWVPAEVMTEAEALTIAEAEKILSPWFSLEKRGEQ